MAEQGLQVSVNEYSDTFREVHTSPDSRNNLAHQHGGKKENFPPVLEVVSPVSGDPLYQLKSPGHIAKLQLARAAAAQQAHRYSMGANPAASNESKAVQAVSRRRAAAEWVESLTGIALPTASDAALRGALRDGLLLCKILNILRPGILPKVWELPKERNVTSEVICINNNVTNFIATLEALDFPRSAIFSLSDLESTGDEDRPRVVECLLTLRRIYEVERNDGKRSPRRPFALSPRSGTPNVSGHPPLRLSQRHSSPFLATPDVNYQAVQQRYFGSAAEQQPGRAGIQVEQANGVTRMMQQCTAMLRDRMGDEAGTPLPANPLRSSQELSSPGTDFSMIAPVFETVLSSLTQEYEKRLLAKDHEIKAAQADARELQKRLDQATAELADTSRLIPAAPAAPQGMADDDRAELEMLRARDAEMEAHFSEQSERMAHSEREAQAQQAVTAQMRAEWEVMKAEVTSMQGMAEKYRATQEENRRLYNEVQDLKGNIRVFCRVRPAGATGDASAGCTEIGEDGELALYNPRSGMRKQFKYDRVFGAGSSQEEVYEDTKALIRSVLDGYNVCIFAYGQTGSGKTHTMAGSDVEDYAGRGINYRALDDLFAINEERQGEAEYVVRVQLLEIYNEQLRDLLDSSRSGRRLEIRNTERSGLNVPEATQVDVSSREEVVRVMEIGARNRAVAETKMNERSSRSHSVLTVIVDGISHITGQRTHGCLHLIDLAGSERVGRSEATGDRLEEAKHINRSLSALGDVMAALAQRNTKHVPFRNSKLTQLLQDSLCGQAKAMMFIHIAPEESSHGESISTLGFGARVSEITLGAAKRNTESGAIFDAKEAVRRAEQEAERSAREATMRYAEESTSAAEQIAALQQQLSAEQDAKESERREREQAEQQVAELKAALAAAQHGAGHLLRAAAPIMTPQVPRPPTSAGLGLDLSSLRLHSSSPTPAPRPQKPRQPSMSPSTLPRVKVKPLNLQQQQLPSRFSPPQEPPSSLRGSLTHRGSTTPRRDSSTGIPRPLTARDYGASAGSSAAANGRSAPSSAAKGRVLTAAQGNILCRGGEVSGGSEMRRAASLSGPNRGASTAKRTPSTASRTSSGRWH